MLPFPTYQFNTEPNSDHLSFNCPLFQPPSFRPLPLKPPPILPFTSYKPPYGPIQVVTQSQPFLLEPCVFHVTPSGHRLPGEPLSHPSEVQHGEVAYHLGHVYLALGRLPEAEGCFEVAMRVNPRHPHFPHSRGTGKRATNMQVDAEVHVRLG